MATRADVKEAVYDEIVAAASGSHTVTDDNGNTRTITLDSSNVSLENPEDVEELPAVVYNDTYRRIVYNGVGAGPHGVTLKSNGDVDFVEWREYIEGLFIIDVRADNELEKEPIYESVRTQFGQYMFDPWEESDVQSDIFDIRTEATSTTDTGGTEDTIRGESVQVYVSFYRTYDRTEEVIEQINTEVDADLDTTTSGLNYTVT